MANRKGSDDDEARTERRRLIAHDLAFQAELAAAITRGDETAASCIGMRTRRQG